MPAPTGLIKWLSEVKPEELAGTVATVVGTLWLTWDRFGKLRASRTVTAAYESTAPVKHRSTPPPTPPPREREPTGSFRVDAAEHQALQARYASTEATLLETQQRIGAVSAALSRHAREAAREEASLSSALVVERAENERLRRENVELRAELMRLRAAPP